LALRAASGFDLFNEAWWCAPMRLLIAVLFLMVLVSFVLSNREPVTVGFWQVRSSSLTTSS
jgi:hypothetical protein